MAKEIAQRGHEIGMHSASHPHMNDLSAEAIQKELQDNKQMIQEVTGYEPNLFRFPFGEYNPYRLSKTWAFIRFNGL